MTVFINQDVEGTVKMDSLLACTREAHYQLYLYEKNVKACTIVI